MDHFDITQSVWNRFRAVEQCKGFKQAGLSTRLITNRRPIEECNSVNMAWLSCASLRLFFKTRKQLFRRISMHTFDFESGMCPMNTKLVWAYVAMNNRLIAKAKRHGVPVILDVPIAHMRLYHEIMEPEFSKYGLPYNEPNWEYWVKRIEEEYLAADWLCVGSHYVKQTLIERGVTADRIVINRTGVDGNHWAKCYQSAQRGSNKLIFIFTASVVLRKGIQYLLEAWRKADLKNAELRIVGGGSLPWDKLAGGPLPGSVTMVGRLNHQQLQDEYSKAHVYVLPSLQEGLARSGLEAMAAGLAMIVTVETGLTDFVQHGRQGWIVESRDAGALAERLSWCAENSEAVSAAQQASYETGKLLDFSAYGRRCADIAKAVIKGNDPSVFCND